MKRGITYRQRVGLGIVIMALLALNYFVVQWTWAIAVISAVAFLIIVLVPYRQDT